MKCPKCGVIIGFGIYPAPGSEAEKRQMRGEIIICGCIPTEIFSCPKCGRTSSHLT